MSQKLQEPYEQMMRRGGAPAVEEMCRFFMSDAKVHRSLLKITEKLAELEIPYAVAGGMALAAHGHVRATVDVNVLLTPEGLKKLHEAVEGLGYVPPFAGSKHLRDTETSVRIEFLTTGAYPGDRKPKPVAFPDPAQVSVDIGGIKYLRLPTLIELKLASGMTNAGRLKDLSDVQELIRTLNLDDSMAQQLNGFVRDKYLELWRAVRDSPPEPQ